jgi:cation transport ATPase
VQEIKVVSKVNSSDKLSFVKELQYIFGSRIAFVSDSFHDLTTLMKTDIGISLKEVGSEVA